MGRMPLENPSLEILLKAYERSLIARVQLDEFGSWGESTATAFRRAIVEHRELEQSYLSALREIRRSRS
jgi:hypothetical protein